MPISRKHFIVINNTKNTLSKGVRAYLGPVATKAQITNNFTSASKQMCSRTRHRATDDIGALQLEFWNGYVSGAFLEVGTGATASITASIEDVSGNILTQVLFSGSATGTIASNAKIRSDLASVSISKGTDFFIRSWFACAAGVPYQSGSSQALISTALGEALEAGATVTDKTMGGTITDTGTSRTRFGPLSILGQTKKRTVLILGDSRAAFVGDTMDAALDMGEIARSIGSGNGYINAAVPADRARLFLASNTIRSGLAALVTDIVCEYGINDYYVDNQTTAQLEANLRAIWALFPGKRVWQSTASPVSSSTDVFLTTANQTTSATVNPKRIVTNDLIRTAPSPLAGYLEVADVVETSRNSGIWRANGTTGGKYTGDGLHGSSVAALAIKNSGNIRSSMGLTP